MIFSAEEIATVGGEIAETAEADLGWQPASTLYGGAHLFGRDAVEKLGAIARRAFRAHTPDGAALARVFGWGSSVDADAVHERLARKLDAAAIEDLRIDFEDGYGVRSSDEEDRDATRAAEELSLALEAGKAPRRIGVRPKAFTRASWGRAVRTLDLFFSGLAARGGVPPGFVVTLPKVRSDEDVLRLGRVLGEIEARSGWTRGAIGAELMLETPRAVLDERGACPLRRWAGLLEGRLVGVHLGSYDLTAALDVAAPDQTPDHPACDLARTIAKTALHGTGVAVVDGATTVLPLARHKAPADDALARENEAVIEGALRLHADGVRAALRRGIHQGWDLHPAQLVARYAAIIAFYMDSLPAMAARLSGFRRSEERASRVGEAFDDAATGAGLVHFFRRGLASGAFDAEEARSAGLSDEELARWVAGANEVA